MKSVKRSIKPFLSVILLVVIALGYLIVKMEVVRDSYDIVRMGRLLKLTRQEQSTLQSQYARLIRPQRLDRIATQRLLLTRVQKNQVVLMASQSKIAVRQ
jgi:hypothetical protein